MKLTTTNIMEMTGCKKGTIEEFRRVLKHNGYLKGSSQLSQEQFEVFKKSLEEQEKTGATLRETFKSNVERAFGSPVQTINLMDSIVPFLIFKLQGQHELTETTLDDYRDEDKIHFLKDIFIPNLKEINPNAKVDDEEVIMYTIKLEDYSFFLIKVDKVTLHVLCSRNHSYNLHHIEYARQVILNKEIKKKFAPHLILL